MKFKFAFFAICKIIILKFIYRIWRKVNFIKVFFQIAKISVSNFEIVFFLQFENFSLKFLNLFFFCKFEKKWGRNIYPNLEQAYYLLTYILIDFCFMRFVNSFNFFCSVFFVVLFVSLAFYFFKIIKGFICLFTTKYFR